MQKSNPLTRFSRLARHWAFIKAIDAGWTGQDTVKDPRCIEFMVHHADIYEIARTNELERRQSDRRAAPRQPVTHPCDPNGTGQSRFEFLSRVGIVRGLYVVLAPDGKYTVTLKVLHPRFGNAYRYGRVPSLAAVWDVLYLWVEKDYWTPDKVK